MTPRGLGPATCRAGARTVVTSNGVPVLSHDSNPKASATKVLHFTESTVGIV